MKKKLVILCLGLCFLAAACSNKGTGERDLGQQIENSAQVDTQDDNFMQQEGDKESDLKNQENDKKEKSDTEDPSQDQETSEDAKKVLSKAPEVTFVDYSQNIQDEESGVLLLSVTENCPVISIPENEAAAEKMNLVFDQQHTTNQTYIQEDTLEAKNAFKALTQEEASTWNGYGYGVSYKVAYASPQILSIVAETYKWQGGAHPNTWTSSYCFNAADGTLLYLSDIFTDKAKAGEIVEKHILDTITKEPYKDALLPDYEGYVADLLTENVFYLNDKGVVVICNPEMLTVYAAGLIEVEIPYEELEAVMNPAYVI